MRCLRTLMLLGVVASIFATPAYAECVSGFGPLWLRQGPRSEFVFDGTVLQLDGVIAQMQVHRVFLGRLPDRLEVYAFQSLDDEPIAVGERYVMAIQRAVPRYATPTQRAEDDQTLAWTTVPCGGTLRSALVLRGSLDGFGPGLPPGR